MSNNKLKPSASIPIPNDENIVKERSNYFNSVPSLQEKIYLENEDKLPSSSEIPSNSNRFPIGIINMLPADGDRCSQLEEISEKMFETSNDDESQSERQSSNCDLIDEKGGNEVLNLSLDLDLERQRTRKQTHFTNDEERADTLEFNLTMKYITEKENLRKSKSLNWSRKHYSSLGSGSPSSEILLFESILRECLEDLDDEERYHLASYYLKDAFQMRKVRYSLATKRVRKIYRIQTHPLWSIITHLLSWTYLILTFFEPAHSSDHTFDNYSTTYWTLFSIEAFIIIISIIDDVLVFIHSFWNEEKRNSRSRIGKKLLLKYFMNINIFIDFVLFWSLYTGGINYFRFGRILRPFKLLFESRDLRRFSKAVLASFPYILDMIILFLLVAFIFAIIAVKLFEDEKDDNNEINEDNNFKDIWHAILSLTTLITFSNYPAVMTPYYQNSNLNFLFFFPFIFFALVFLVPIPVAVIFDAFRNYRSKTILKDRLREKEALYAVYVCIDYDKSGFITNEQWSTFLSAVYSGKEDTIKVKSLFDFYDKDSDQRLNMFEFFDACDLVLYMRDFSISFFCDPNWWICFRKFCNTKLKIINIIESKWFELIIFIFIILNIVILVLYALTTDEKKIRILDLIDRIILAVFILEVILKIIGLGVVKYFADNWNKFDFSLVVLSLLLDFSVNIFQIIKTAQAAKGYSSVAKIGKSQRVLKGFRSFKAGRIITVSSSPFTRVRDMVQKIVLCLPSVHQLLTLLVIFFYVYSIVGLEVFSEFGEETIYSGSNTFVGNFSTLAEAIVVLFQVLTQSGWHCSMFHYALNTSYAGSLIFFISFHMITIYVMFSIITGLVWEIFNMLHSKHKDVIRDFKSQTNQIHRKSIENNKNKSQKLKRLNSIHALTTNALGENSQSLEGSADGPIICMEGRKSKPISGLSNDFHDIFRRTSTKRNTLNKRNSAFAIQSILRMQNNTKRRNALAPDDPFMASTKQLKSQYILRQALLYDSSKTKLKKIESKYLDKKFQGYGIRVTKVLQDYDKGNEDTEASIVEAIFLFKILKKLYNPDPDKPIAESLNDIFSGFRRSLPFGAFVHIAFESDNNFAFFPIADGVGIELSLNGLKEKIPFGPLDSRPQTVYQKKFYSKIGRLSNDDLFPHSELFETVAKLEEIQGYKNTQLDGYYFHNWELICCRFTEKEEYNSKLKDSRSILPVDRVECSESIENKEIMRKGYIIGLIPKFGIKEGEEKKIDQINKIQAKKIMEITGNRGNDYANHRFDTKEMHNFIEYLGVLFYLNRQNIFAQITQFAHSAMFYTSDKVSLIIGEQEEIVYAKDT